MTSTRSAMVPALALGAAALLAAVFLAPFRVASLWTGNAYPDVGVLRSSVTDAFVAFWSSGESAMGPDLAGPVDFWAKFHLVKALLAAALLVTAVLLGGSLWRITLDSSSVGRRVAAGAAGVVTGGVAVLALVLLAANVQGVIAPLSSVLGLMPLGTPKAGLADTVTQVRNGLESGSEAPTLALLLGDFVAYHVAMVVIGAVVTIGLGVASVVVWRRRRRSGRPGERALLVIAALALFALAGFFGLVTTANASTAARPAPALLGFFESGA